MTLHSAPPGSPSAFSEPASSATAPAAATSTATATATAQIFERIDEAEASQLEANRSQAKLWAALAELMWLARQNPHVYLRTAALNDPETLEFAQDAAAFDIGLRLRLSAQQVRTIAHRAQDLATRMPLLHAVFTAGRTGAAHVTAALELAAGWDDPDAVARFDAELSEHAATLTPSAFRSRARRVKERLSTEPAVARHQRAHADRRVWLEAAEDGMAWIHAFIGAPDAVRIAERLNATARAEQKKTPVGNPAWRSRNQIRADLATAWLAGDGTPTAAKVRPVILVPLLTLLGHDTPGAGTGAGDTAAGASGGAPVILQGYGPIDTVTAARLLAEAPSFRRVGTDPFTSEKLIFDTGRYRPTRAQRDWITMRFEQCVDPTCSRPATDSDVDHLEEWVRDNGQTNDDNLFPLCERGNRRKNISRFDYTRLADGRVSITTPTGFTVETEGAPF